MNNVIRRAVRYTLMTCAVSALASPAVLAQSASAGSAQDQGQNVAATTQLSKVEVTGTRIKQTNVETAQPITIITAKQIQQSGLVTVSQVLQNITQSGGGATPESQVQSTTAGTTTIDLRYFGSDRVLVLVNGRRWTPTLGGSVDLSAIPSSIIDHIEVLQDGASAIYGSDAITGVINIITKKNFNGAEAHAYMGMYNANGDGGGWDGKTQSYDFTLGSQGARGGVVFSASYTNTNPVMAANRTQSKEPIWTQGKGAFTMNAPGFYIIQSPQLANAQLGSATCDDSGTCTLGTKNVPAFNPTLSDFENLNVDSFDKQALEMFATPSETQSFFFNGHYDLASNVTFTSMAQYTLRDSHVAVYPSPWDFGSAGFWHANGKGIGIGVNNPYNPFGVDLVGNTSQYCPDGHTLGGQPVASCMPNYLLNFYERVPPEMGNREYYSNVSTRTFRMGLNGFFDVLNSEWDWDLGFSFGNSYNSQRNINFNNTTLLANQLDSPGFSPCNGPAQSAPGSSGTWQNINGKYYQILQPGCVPINPFGGYNAATGQGTLTPAMLNYSRAEEHDIESTTLRDYTANITGSLVQLPAGPLSVAVGGEYLEQDGFYAPDSASAQGNLTNNAAEATNGRTWTNAEYVEFNVPILQGVPMARSLSLDLANRWSQFTWKGGNPGEPDFGVKNGASSTTGRAQLRWQPTDSLLLRGSWAQGFRAPSISDLYSGISVGYGIIQDPCAPDTANGGWNPSTPLPAGCHGVQHVQPELQIAGASGGNSDLRPENAISRSFGFVYSPNWLPGFNFSADYYKIELDNSIGTVGENFILQQCYINDNPQYCSHIITSGNVITQINDTDVNVGEEYSNGVDVTAGYALPTTPIGDFRINTNWTFVRSFVNVVPDAQSPTGFEAIEEAGFTSDLIPKMKGTLTATWNLDNWSAAWEVQYIGKMYERCSSRTISMNECSEPNAIYGPTGSTGKNQLGTTIYHDVSLTYHADPINTDFTFGVRNLFNKEYPAGLAAFKNSFYTGVGYRIPGRFVYARVGVKF